MVKFANTDILAKAGGVKKTLSIFEKSDQKIISARRK